MHVSMHAEVLDMRTTATGHCDSCNGIVWYASAMSQVAACNPGGRYTTSKKMVENLPHMHGSKLVVVALLMDRFGKQVDVWIGKEKFCTKRKFSGLPGLGIRESRNDWNGPIAASIIVNRKGPM